MACCGSGSSNVQKEISNIRVAVNHGEVICVKMARNNTNQYIYYLPHLERKELCRILDQNNKWEELGGVHMQYDSYVLQDLKREIFRGNSPTDVLLTMWGHQNHTVLELFILLSRMQHYQAMVVLKNFVESKYHVLIHEGEHNLNDLLKNLTLSKQRNAKMKQLYPEAANKHSSKILNVDHNYNQGVYKTEQVKIVLENEPMSREDNESIAIDQKLLPKPKSPLLIGHASTCRTLTVSDISSVAESAVAIPQISYDELLIATNNWCSSSILGKGGFGTVFKGIWKCTQVAIKRIEQKENDPKSYNEQVKQSITELHCLNAYRHDNVLPLYGYSIGGLHPCLVYQYMSGGSLEYRLRVRDASKFLNWIKRLNIAIGTARGLQFLHTIGDKPLIHGDIKPANILLDPSDNAKIGDFGLAREGPHSDYTHIKVSKVHGTLPYVPEEFLRAKQISTKVDTYSFGVVLFEIATALSAYSEQRKNKFLKDHVVEYEGNILDLKDKRAENGDNCFKSIIDIGKLCVSRRAKDRPEMVSVLIQLEGVNVDD